MSNIIAGRFQTQDEVAGAVQVLESLGIAHGAISSFYVNPAGQHDLYPVGGDEDKSRGAKETGGGVVEGASVGGVVGVAVGAAALPVTGPMAPVIGGLVGGYVGSLIGGMNATKERYEPEEGGENREVNRKAGMMVAVATGSLQQEHDVMALMKSLHADAIERSDGTIADGDWADFDPLSAPQFQS